MELIRFLFVFPDGSQKKVTVMIRWPVQEESGSWQCQVLFAGLDKHDRVIFGADALQSLSLCLCFVQTELLLLRRDGIRILDESGEFDYPLEALMPERN